MKKKKFLVVILFLTWLNYLLSYEYVKTMMDTADASKVSNTMVLLIFPIMWNYGAAIIKIISSIVLIIITLIYQTNDYVDIRKICYSSDESHRPSPHLWTALQFQAESDPDASLQKALTPPHQANPMKSQNENS